MTPPPTIREHVLSFTAGALLSTATAGAIAHEEAACPVCSESPFGHYSPSTANSEITADLSAALLREVAPTNSEQLGVHATVENICSQLDELKKLESNWDGEGAPKISDSSLAAAEAFARDTLAELPFLPYPFVSPSRTGHAKIEWEYELDEHFFYMEIYFLLNEYHYYTCLDDFHEEGRGSAYDVKETIRFRLQELHNHAKGIKFGDFS